MDNVLTGYEFYCMETITITLRDYDRLTGLPRTNGAMMPEKNIGALRNALKNARKTSPDKIQSSVVTMNSKVLVKELNSGRQSEVTLVYPSEAAHHSGRVSVLSPVGLALLGRREREVVTWKVPHGTGSFEIVKVIYQPEAAGDYHL
jgi:regulator of nucleoside diphosphate kinase